MQFSTSSHIKEKLSTMQNDINDNSTLHLFQPLMMTVSEFAIKMFTSNKDYCLRTSASVCITCHFIQIKLT